MLTTGNSLQTNDQYLFIINKNAKYKTFGWYQTFCGARHATQGKWTKEFETSDQVNLRNHVYRLSVVRCYTNHRQNIYIIPKRILIIIENRLLHLA